MSENKRYYWLKLPKDFFRSIEMKRLRKLAGGDTYTIIYLKMMLLSLEDNGVIYYEGVCPTLNEELALELDEDEDNIQVVVNYLKSVGLIEVKKENTFELSQVEEMTGSETESAKRVRRHRRREALNKAIDDNEELQSNAPPLQCNTDVTKCNTEKEIEIEIDKDIEIDKEIDSMGTNVPASASIDFEAIKDYWNGLELKPAIRNITAKRQGHIRARIREFDLDTFYQMMDMVSESDFLRKPSNTWFSFDWCINVNNFTKIIEGKYRDEVKSDGINSRSEQEEYFAMLDEWAKEG